MGISAKLVTSLACAAGLLLATSADKADAANLAGRNVKIGCLASLTGKGAEWGQAAKISMDIAVQETNAKGGIGGIPAEFGGHPPFLSQTWIGGVLEFYGGAAILLGLWTRPVAFVLSGEMAVAYFQFHQPNGLWPIQNHGEPAVLLCFIFLFFAAHGAGDWSVDAMIRKKSARRTAS